MGLLKDSHLNRHTGHWSFVIHRITGILLAVYLIPHILVNSSALFGGKIAYDNATMSVQGGFWHILEALIILGVSFHLFNGVRIILIDLCGLTSDRAQKGLLFWACGMTILVFVYCVWFYVGKI